MKNKINSLQIYNGSRAPEKREILCRTIWEDYFQGITLFTRAFFGKTSFSEDVVQEIFTRVFDNLEKYNPLFAFSTWIYRIARNYCINRKKKYRAEVEKQSVFDMDTVHVDNHPLNLQPDEAVVREEARQDIASFVETLEEQDRMIVFLHYSEDMKYRQISRVLGLPVGTIKYRVFTIKGKLKDFWEARNG